MSLIYHALRTVFHVKVSRYPQKNMNIYCYHNKVMLFTMQFVQT